MSRTDCYTPEGFIDWPKIFSYGADYNLIIDARTRGKTYGARKYALRYDYLKRGDCYVEISRYADFLKGGGCLQDGYFDKFAQEYATDPVMSKYLLRTVGKVAQVARIPEGKEKPSWETCAYFLALTDKQETKQRSTSFKPVRRFFFDEALIEPDQRRYHDYLPGEIGDVASLMSSVCRERPGVEGTRPSLYLMGNAVDLTCPWLAHFGITTEPPYGFSWHYGHKCLLWYGPPDEDWAAHMDKTVAGGLIAGTDEGAAATLNRFAQLDAAYFARPPKRARFSFGVAHAGKTFGVWLDADDGYYYVVRGLPKSLDGKPVYALTADDARPNYVMARRAQRSLRSFVDLYYMGIVRYQDHGCRADFLKAMSLFGVR